MSQAELLKKTATCLERLGIPFMLTGSLASSMQGEPRATHDIDLVVDLPQAKQAALARELAGPDTYLSEEAMRQAIAEKGMFNLLDTREGDKVDFWLLTDDPYDRRRFERRVRVDFEETPLWVSTAEDTILMKLRWSKWSGQSARHEQDARRVMAVQAGSLDRAYLEHWVARLGLEEAWQRLHAEPHGGN